MNQQERKELYDEAARRLTASACDPRKLVLIHTGIMLLVSLLVAAIQYLLEQQIGSTGGIGGLGSRALLSTAQAVLQIAQLLLLPLWEMGFLFTALKLSRQEAVSPMDLAGGLQRFFPCLRLHVVRTAIFAVVGFVSIYLGTVVFFATPFARPMLGELLPLLSDEAVLADPLALEALMMPIMEKHMAPLLAVTALIFLGLSIPLMYHYRMATYFLLDEPQKGAFNALRSSRRMMRHLCMDLFRLDLRFWLFYLLDLLITAVCYGDVLLTLFGIPLPFDAATAYFVFMVAYALCQLALYYFKRAHVEVTYAGAYCLLRSKFDPLPAEAENTRLN